MGAGDSRRVVRADGPPAQEMPGGATLAAQDQIDDTL